MGRGGKKEMTVKKEGLLRDSDLQSFHTVKAP